MIKRIIFDFDNTLIPWIDKYDEAIKEAIDKFNIVVDYNELMRTLFDYEYVCDRYDKQELVDYVNEKLNLNLSIDFLNYWLSKLGTMSYASEELKDTLEYLSSKYELVILTNWFRESQLARLKHAGIDKYFVEIYSGEVNKKPSKEAFIRALGDKKIDECIMVGDNYHFDIEPAINLGMRSILVGNKKDNINAIDNVIELKEML